MDPDLKGQISQIYSQLSDEQQANDIVGLEYNSENTQIIEYLEK